MNRALFIGMIKDWLLAFVVVIGVIVLWNVVSPAHVTTGTTAPSFTLSGPSGEHLTLDELRGQRVVLNFWATWCPPCRQEIPAFAAFHKEHPEVPLYGISVDEDLKGRALALQASRLGVTYPVLHDPISGVADSYRVHGIPATVIIDRDGGVVASHEGPLSLAGLERMFATKPAPAAAQ